MKSTIFKFFSLFSVIRLYNILVVILAQYLTAIFILDDQKDLLVTILDPYLFVIILCSSISIASGYIINNFYDYEKDIINRPIRSNIDRSIRKRTKLNLYFSLNILCTILSLYISIRAVIFFLVYNIILWLYSHKLKKILILGNVLSSLLTITPFFAIFLYYKNFSDIILVYALFLFFIILAKDLVKDLENLKGDFTLNYKTIAVVYGEKFSKTAITSIIIINYIIVISLILYFDIGLMFYYYYLCLLVLSFVLFFTWISNDKRDYLIIHNIMRALIILGIFSIILI
ncbi:MAG: ubiquinone biosynthesis protein UbiA [Flavobacteriales bacterium]|nr:MAG: ubiquinone biosynthesis protein UbiA [Flavobacteriales bacterium]